LSRVFFPTGTGPETAVTGQTGFSTGRFQTGSNLKFKFEFKKMKKSQKIHKILQVATNLMVSIFFKYSFI